MNEDRVEQLHLKWLAEQDPTFVIKQLLQTHRIDEILAVVNTHKVLGSYTSDELLDEVSISDAIDYYGSDKLLREINEDDTFNYFCEVCLDKNRLDTLCENYIDLNDVLECYDDKKIIDGFCHSKTKRHIDKKVAHEIIDDVIDFEY